MTSKNDLYILKTGNDLTFHYMGNEKIDVMEGSIPIQITAKELENRKIPFYILDPGTETMYSVYHFKKVK